MAKARISINELQMGMYVELPDSWFAHDFLSNKFKITSSAQLNELRKLRFKQIIVDFDKSDFKPTSTDLEKKAPEPGALEVGDPKLQPPPPKWSSDKLMTDDLRNVLDDQNLPPEKKSAIVYQHSVSMMEQLLEFPSIENIQASKEAIYAISETVLGDDDTAQNMMRITSHDFYTYTHSVNVGLTSIMLCKELFKNSDAHDLQELAAGFFLHDLGKVNIDPDVLNKPSRLTDTEFQHIKTHPYQGYKLLKEAHALSPECSTIVMQHHEYMDGTGYPHRVKDKEIHLYGKICAIADVFDALTAERSYKKAMKPFGALTLMKNEMINHFDQKLFLKFVKLF